MPLRTTFSLIAGLAIAGSGSTGVVAAPSRGTHQRAACEGTIVQHRIAPGETLFRIAREYGVELEALEAVNGIQNPRHVAAGSNLLIPCPVANADAKVQRPSDGAGVGSEAVLDGGDFVEVPGEEKSSAGALDEIAAASTIGASPCRSPSMAAWTWPVQPAIASPFGTRHHRLHAGIDLRASLGTPVHAAGCGVVAAVRLRSRGYGTVVTIDHGEGFMTLYAHLQQASVKEGQTIGAGDILGLVGRTGNATGPHLHFEVRLKGKTEDPEKWMPQGADGGGGLAAH